MSDLRTFESYMSLTDLNNLETVFPLALPLRLLFSSFVFPCPSFHSNLIYTQVKDNISCDMTGEHVLVPKAGCDLAGWGNAMIVMKPAILVPKPTNPSKAVGVENKADRRRWLCNK